MISSRSGDIALWSLASSIALSLLIAFTALLGIHLFSRAQDPAEECVDCVIESEVQ